MPRHKQITTCHRGGAVSKMCSCVHCALAVCEVCDGAEGTLTTDCPGPKVSYERHQEVFETSLDYTDDRGWHMAAPGEQRSPRFESTEVPSAPPPIDHRVIVAPSIDWSAVDRITDLKHELSQKAIAWVLADRVADDHSAKLTRLEDETAAHLPQGQEPSKYAQEILKTLEYEKMDFHLANQHAEKCDDEFRQTSRRLVTALETARAQGADTPDSTPPVATFPGRAKDSAPR